MIRQLAIALTLTLVPLAHAAELVWEQTHLDRAADPGVASIEATYRFRNVTGHPVTIIRLSPSCRCTAATIGKSTYAPGETGVVQVVLTPGGETGELQKTVTIDTADSKGEAVLLLRARIQEFVTLTPRMIRWSKAEGALEKAVLCSSGAGHPLKLAGIMTTNPHFEVRIEPVEAGRSVRIVIRPAGAVPGEAAFVGVRVDAGQGRLRQLDAEVVQDD